MTTERVAWADTPPPQPEPYIPIMSPYRDERLSGVVISPYITGAWTHYVKPRTTPCIEPREECAGCRAQFGRRWRGYFAVQTAGRFPISIFEITAETVRAWHTRLTGQAEGMRGYQVFVYRKGGMERGKVLLEFGHLQSRLCDLPEPIDVRRVLERAWGAPTKAPEQKVARPGLDDWEVIPY